MTGTILLALELRQYKNDLMEAKNRLVLTLSHFLLALCSEGKIAVVIKTNQLLVSKSRSYILLAVFVSQFSGTHSFCLFLFLACVLLKLVVQSRSKTNVPAVARL